MNIDRFRRPHLSVALVGAAVTVAALVAGCSSSAKSATTNDTTTTVSQTPTTKDQSGGGQGAGTTSAPLSGPAPEILTFVTPVNIDCHNGNSQAFSAIWTTKNAVKTTISIDGAGVYKTYGSDGIGSLPFDCSSSHTFLLTAVGQDGRTAAKTLTLQPRNVQPTTTTGSDDTPTSDTPTSKP